MNFTHFMPLIHFYASEDGALASGGGGAALEGAATGTSVTAIAGAPEAAPAPESTATPAPAAAAVPAAASSDGAAEAEPVALRVLVRAINTPIA